MKCQVLCTIGKELLLSPQAIRAESRRSNIFSAGKAVFRKRGRNGSLQSGKSNAVGAEDEQQMAAFPFQAVFNKS